MSEFELGWNLGRMAVPVEPPKAETDEVDWSRFVPTSADDGRCTRVFGDRDTPCGGTAAFKKGGQRRCYVCARDEKISVPQTGSGGTYSCPICGYDKPHHHSADEVAEWRASEAAGYRSAPKAETAQAAEPAATGTTECPICGTGSPHGHTEHEIDRWRNGWKRVDRNEGSPGAPAVDWVTFEERMNLQCLACMGPCHGPCEEGDEQYEVQRNKRAVPAAPPDACRLCDLDDEADTCEETPPCAEHQRRLAEQPAAPPVAAKLSEEQLQASVAWARQWLRTAGCTPSEYRAFTATVMLADSAAELKQLYGAAMSDLGAVQKAGEQWCKIAEQRLQDIAALDAALDAARAENEALKLAAAEARREQRDAERDADLQELQADQWREQLATRDGLCPRMPSRA